MILHGFVSKSSESTCFHHQMLDLYKKWTDTRQMKSECKPCSRLDIHSGSNSCSRSNFGSESGPWQVKVWQCCMQCLTPSHGQIAYHGTMGPTVGVDSMSESALRPNQVGHTAACKRRFALSRALAMFFRVAATSTAMFFRVAGVSLAIRKRSMRSASSYSRMASTNLDCFS